MTADDEREFCEFVLLNPAVLILPDQVESLPPPELRPPLPVSVEASPSRYLLLWNKNIDAEPRYVQIRQGLLRTAGAQEGGIQFLRCVTQRGSLRAGRLWASPGSMNMGAKQVFSRWINTLFQWIKKRYIKQHGIGFYIAPGALRFQEAGGKLCEIYEAMENRERIETRLI